MGWEVIFPPLNKERWLQIKTSLNPHGKELNLTPVLSIDKMCNLYTTWGASFFKELANLTHQHTLKYAFFLM